MKYSIIALLFSASSSMASLTICGYTLVNNYGWSQTDIAKAVCGRTDSCDGKEWNMVFEKVRHSEGPSEWSTIESTGLFCIQGCYEGASEWNAQCH